MELHLRHQPRQGGEEESARVLAVLPQRGRDAMYKRLVPNQVKATDPTTRAEYEARRLPGA